MDSHILNTFHQANYRGIGHRTARESSSSECSSGNHTSPEHIRNRQQQQYKDTNEDVWRNSSQKVTMHQIQETSSDEEQEPHNETSSDDEHPSLQQILNRNAPNAYQYDLITIIPVDPNAESSDEDEPDHSVEIHHEVTVPSNEVVYEDSVDESEYMYVQHMPNDAIDYMSQEVFNPNDHVVSNVDEYFVKDNKDGILDVEDKPVVLDVDAFFVKNDKPQPQVEEDYCETIIKSEPAQFGPNKLPLDQADEPIRVEDFFNAIPRKPELHVQNRINTEAPLSYLNAGPTIEDIKHYLQGDIPNLKTRHKSFSLPQSPHLDIDDPKTSISFEDVTEYIEGCRDSSEICTLTDEDVNSFLITNNQAQSAGIKDELSSDEMEIASPVHNPVTVIHSVPALLDFCIEKPAAKKEPIVERTMKVEPEDFVDVESCNDAAIPVIEANSLSSLLEQYEATEKANTKPKKIIVKNEDIKLKPATLTSGNSQQDAKMHMNKNKMRQIVVPPVGGPVVRRSSSPARLDHDYCTSKRQKSLPVIRGGQSLLKPEVLSSNNKILSSRHRACKNKKVVYHESDDESENKNKNKKTNKSDDSDVVFNSVKKASLKSEKVMPNAIRKKPSPVHSVINDFKVKGNDTVMVNDASKARDNPNSQTCNGRIKLTIKNKSEVILSCDVKDSQKDKVIEKSNPSSVNKPVVIKSEIKDNIQTKVTKLYKEEEIKNIKVEEVDKTKFVKTVKVEESEKIKIVKHVKDEEGEKQKNVNKPVQNNKEESRPKVENLYTGLITNKKDVHIPVGMKAKKEKRTFEEELTMASKVEAEQPQKKKKLNLQEYKMRRGVSSNNSSTAVSPESIFPEMPSALNLDKTKSVSKKSSSNGVNTVTVQATKEVPKKMFDPIMEASRKILMNTKKQKAAAMRKRDEDIVMRKIPKVENLELQPLMSEADMMKMVGMAPVEAQPAPVVEKPQAPAEYDEIVMVSAGTCTDENVFRQLQKPVEKTKSLSPVDTKNLINFKIKKSDQILKKNVFESHSSHSRQEESHKRDKKSPTEDKRNTDIKINKERLRDITATLKSVEKNVDKKIPSNSLFANIKNLVLKKSPEEEKGGGGAKRRLKSDSPKREEFHRVKTAIVREYDTKTEHGEDKVILHLGKNRTKPESAHRAVQTDQSRPKKTTESSGVKRASPPIAQTNRKRTESDMSMSSEGSPVRPKESSKVDEARRKPASNVKRSRSKEKRSRSTERHDKYKRSRSPARAQKRKRSPSRSRSRSRGYRRYRRSDSPYRRRRRSRSRSRSHYRSRRSPSHRRSPSPRRDYRRPKFDAAPARPAKKSASPPKVNGAEKAPPKKSMTPPPRKPTVSESSDSSSSSSSSSTSTSSSSSEESRPRRSVSPYRQEYRNEYKAYSGDDREKQSVEERRIVFVGKLENDITKSRLRSQFVQFGPIIEVRLHSKEDGSRYGFVTFQRPRDAWTAVESHSKFPYYDIGFGGRRAFCGHKYADLDGLEAKYTESAFHGMPVAPRLPTLTLDDDVMTFDDLLSDVREKITQRKSDNPTTSDEP